MLDSFLSPALPTHPEPNAFIHLHILIIIMPIEIINYASISFKFVYQFVEESKEYRKNGKLYLHAIAWHVDAISMHVAVFIHLFSR